jgi:hypothetical protein
MACCAKIPMIVRAGLSKLALRRDLLESAIF